MPRKLAPPPLDCLITRQATADRLGIDVRTLDHWAYQGLVSAWKVGPRMVRYDRREIDRLACLAPMENPYNLIGINACEKLTNGITQVAVFDTAFHLRMPLGASRYALPKDLASNDLRRFGSHGISHEGAARTACAFLGMNFDALKLITCHQGTGASMTAIDHGRSVDNTMGMTPLAGMLMR